MKQQDILRKITQHKIKIKSYGVKRLILVGSYAQGTAKTKSDIDLVVEFEKGRGLFDDYIHLLNFLEDLFRKEIDLGDINYIREELKSSILGGKQFEAKL